MLGTDFWLSALYQGKGIPCTPRWLQVFILIGVELFSYAFSIFIENIVFCFVLFYILFVDVENYDYWFFP